MDILIGAFVGLKYGRFKTFGEVFSFLVSLFVVLFYTFVTIIISIKVWVFGKKNKDKIEDLHKYSMHKRWDFLKLGIKKDMPFASYVIGINIIKDYIVAPIIVLGIESAMFQCIPIIILMILILIFILVRRPFNSWLENTTLIVNNLCYSVVLILFLKIEKSTHLTPKEKYNKLGTPSVVFIITILMINLCVAVFTIVSLVVAAWKKARGNYKNKISQVGLKMKIKGF